MSACQKADFGNQPFSKKTALVCKADFTRDFCLDCRSAVSRLTVDVKHTRRPVEISRVGVRINPGDGTEHSQRTVKDNDVVRF